MSSDDASVRRKEDSQPILDHLNHMMALVANYLDANPELKMSDWDLMPKGPALKQSEIEDLKNKIATHYTNRMNMSPDFLRRLIQTYESLLNKEVTGYTEELPEIGSVVHIFVNIREAYPVIVVAHLSKARILVFNDRGLEDSDKICVLDSWIK